MNRLVLLLIVSFFASACTKPIEIKDKYVLIHKIESGIQ